MARLKVISTGSAGNAYVLTAGGETLLLELGVPFSDILKALDFDISGVVGCLCSHIHADHYQSAQTAKRYQMRVYLPHNLKSKQKYRLGGFTFMPLQVPHGECKCYAYVIEHEGMGKLLFATDLSSFPYTIRGLDHIMMECNYSHDVLIENAAENGGFGHSRYEDHMALDECVITLDRLNHKHLKNVVLIHMSHTNGDPALFDKTIFEETGIRTVTATNGMEFEFEKEEF